jgi:hypothetical protein
VQVNENNWKSFVIDCDGTQVSITVKSKVFKKVEQAKENYPMWVGACSSAVPGGNTGKLGEATEKGFILDQPNIQVFERKPKEPKPSPEATS